MLAFFPVLFSNPAHAYGTITSGTFDEPPDDEELADWYAVYEENDKYVVDKFAGAGMVMPAACARGSKILHNQINSNGIHEDYLAFDPSTAHHFTFVSTDESVATADTTAFYCNGVGRTTIHINNNVYSPERYKHDIPFEIVVYDIETNDESIREQLTATINRAMVVLANGGEMPETIDDATAAMLYDILVTGKNLGAVLGVDLVTEEDVPDEDLGKINEQIADGETIASYYDISIETSEENVDDAGHVYELEDDIEVAVELPELPELADGYTRTFFAVRLHNGVAERIDDIAINNDKATIPTDRFSIYALGYSDNLDIKAPNTGLQTTNNGAASIDYVVILITAIATTSLVALMATKKTRR